MYQSELAYFPVTTSSIEKFRAYHARHPIVYTRFVEFALRMISRGRTHYSARTIIEVTRFHTDLDTRATETFKLNDHYTPFYVRMFEYEYPEHVGFFERRRAKADDMATANQRTR